MRNVYIIFLILGHFLGENSILTTLKNMGYSIKPIKEDDNIL